MEVVDVPICLDSADPRVMEAALSVYGGKMLLSSVTGEPEKLSEILPLVKSFGTAVVAMCMDENGIPNDAGERLAIAERIVSRAEALGIAREDVIVDCACMAVCTDGAAALVTLETARLIRERLGSNITLGASNVSYGYPDRKAINAAFLPLAIAAGINCPIVDPTVPEIASAILAADVLLGKDEYGMGYIKAYRARQAAAPGDTEMKAEMTPRERVLAALNHEEPDRVPLDLAQAQGDGITIAAYRERCFAISACPTGLSRSRPRWAKRPNQTRTFSADSESTSGILSVSARPTVGRTYRSARPATRTSGAS